jgi:DNA-binding CsgD family transcriptional regulator/PAS domain-containing protein
MTVLERSALFARPVETLRSNPGDGGFEEAETLRLILEHFNADMEADGAFLLWDGGPGRQAVLCSSGECGIDAANEHLLEGTGVVPEGGVYWRTVEVAGGSLQALTICVPAPNGTMTLNSLFRRITDGTRVRAREVALKGLPLLRGLFAILSLRRGMVARLHALTSALDNADMGLILADRRAQLLFANRVAQRLMDRRDGIRCSGGAIGATLLADSLALHAAIEHVVSGGGLGPMAESAPVVALRRSGAERPLLAAVMPGDADGDTPEGAGVAIYLFDTGEDLQLRLEPACRFYGLSPVETRLACCLAEGFSVTEAAEQLRVREQTARSYLKQIFMKTATNRQGELVSLLLKSCVRIAPQCSIDLV